MRVCLHILPPLGPLLLGGLLLAASPNELRSSESSQPSAAQTAPPQTHSLPPESRSSSEPSKKELTVQFDPSSGTPPAPPRPRQVPMIVLVIVWLSIVTFWYLRGTRDPESPGR